MSFLPLSLARANKNLRRRLTLSFPKAVDCRVMVLELPNRGHLSFGVEAAGDEFDLVMESFDEALATTAEQPLATFAKREDAMKALGKVRRALTRPMRRAFGWLLLALLAVFVLDGLQSALRGGAPLPITPMAQQAPGVAGAPIALTPAQITALQQSMYAPPPGSQPVPQAGVPGLPDQPPAIDSSAPAAAAGQPGAPSASLYQNPNQPQDPTGGALSQLSNSR